MSPVMKVLVALSASPVIELELSFAYLKLRPVYRSRRVSNS